MNQQKKRHNPPIHDEESAVQAFDRNNDAAPADSLEGKVKTSSVEVVKTQRALMAEEERKRKEENRSFNRKFFELIDGSFGIENYKFDVTYHNGIMHGIASKTIESILDTFDAEGIIMKRKNKWYEGTNVSTELLVEIIVDLSPKKEQVSQEDTETNRTFVNNKKYSPIKIKVYNIKEVSKAKLFAQKYQELTGQKATVIQDCPDEEITEQDKLEAEFKKIEETSKGEKAPYSVESLKTDLTMLKLHTGFIGLNAGIAAGYLVKDHGVFENPTLMHLGLAALASIFMYARRKGIISKYKSEIGRLVNYTFTKGQ